MQLRQIDLYTYYTFMTIGNQTTVKFATDPESYNFIIRKKPKENSIFINVYSSNLIKNLTK